MGARLGWGMVMIFTREPYSEIDGRLGGDAVHAFADGECFAVGESDLGVYFTRSSRRSGSGVYEGMRTGHSLCGSGKVQASCRNVRRDV